jgi:glycosyltransferase involved in cell wall biosynthesis
MRILLINDHFEFNGGADAPFHLDKLIYRRAGHNVFTFSISSRTPHFKENGDFVFIENSNRFISKMGKFTIYPQLVRDLRRIVKSIRPELIKVNLVYKYASSIYVALADADCPLIQVLHGPNLFCATSWGCLRKTGADCEMGIGFKCWKRGCAPITTVLPYLFMNLHLSRLIRKTVSVFLCPTRHLQKSAASLGFTPAEVIPLCIDPAFASAEPARFDGPPTILYVGALIEQKGVHILLDAFEMVRSQVPGARLLFAGRGDMEGRLRKAAMENGMGDSVLFLGFVKRSEMVELYRRAHVLAVPSVWKEQFGLVGPEALACGLPCVGSAIGGIPEWLHDGEWGFLVPPRDALVLAQRLVTVLRDDAVRQEFAERGRAFALEEFSPERYEANVLRNAEKLYEAKGKAG